MSLVTDKQNIPALKRQLPAECTRSFAKRTYEPWLRWPLVVLLLCGTIVLLLCRTFVRFGVDTRPTMGADVCRAWGRPIAGVLNNNMRKTQFISVTHL